MKKYFQISVHALLISAFIALALTGRLDAPSIVVFSAGILYSLWRTLQELKPPLSARGAFFLSCGYIAFFLFDSVILSRSFIPAAIHLVLFLELAKLFQEKADKDYFYLILLAFLKVLAASSLTIDMSFVAALLLFLTTLVSTLMSFDMYRSERAGAPQAQNAAAALSSMSVWATLWIVVMGAALFLVIPRVGTGYFSRAASQSLLLSGFTENVQLGEIGQVKLNSAVVMRARLVSGEPYAVLKWRGIALDMFDGHSWRKTDRKHSRIAPSNDEYWIHPIDRSGKVVLYDILLEPLATTALFAPYQARAVTAKLPGLEVDNDESIYARAPALNRFQYQVLSEIPARAAWNAPAADDSTPIPSEIRARYLQLPANLDPRIRSLAAQIAGKGTSTIERASLVEAYLRRNYKYTLNLTWNPGEQPLVTFLFDAKEGHCEYFASSMAILLRTVGIPTRLVNGFQMGEYNPVGQDYIVRQSDAHSWVEVYVPGRGWQEFDPTPADPNQREMSLAVQLGQYIDAMQLYWNSYVLIYDSSLQSQLFRSAQEKAQSLQTEFRNGSDRWIEWGQNFSSRVAAGMRSIVETVWFWILAAVVTAAVAAFRRRASISTGIRIWRLRRRGGNVDEQVIQQLFYRAARLADSERKPRKAGQTWREWLQQMPDSARRDALARALEIFEKCKYGPRSASISDFAFLEQTIRQLKV